MRRLYDEREVLTDKGQKVSKELKSAIEPFVKKLAVAGYSLNDVERIVDHTGTWLVAIYKLRRNCTAK